MAKFEDIYHSDIYTGSGSVSLLNCWTANVDKHDTSSFYNWEQDNEPLYDLEERTHLNWERLGFPTSSVPGLALVVSADADITDATGTGCNRSVFLTLSSCLDSLPRFINFPVLIEVANFGNLGNMNIKDIQIGDKGSIEIINRNSYRGLSNTLSGDGAGVFEQVGTDQTNHPFNRGILGPAVGVAGSFIFSDYNNFSSVSHIDETYVGKYAPGETNSWTLKNQIMGASALSISALVVSAQNDPRLHGNINLFIAGVPRNSGNWGLTVGVDGGRPLLSGTMDQVSCVPYEESNAAEVFPYDASAYNNIAGSAANIAKFSVDTAPCNSRVYGNYLNSIEITNCEGPLYIRGFLVNGKRAVQDGIIVKNSNVVLEGCASILNNGNGFLFDNSDITLTRGVLAYRNYLTSGVPRLDGDWSSIAIDDFNFKDETAGIKAVNSNITLSSTSAFEFSIRDSASGIYPVNDMNQCSRNTNGISLINSVFNGGLEQTTNMAVTAAGSINHKFTRTYFSVDKNTNNGLLSEGSNIDLKGRLTSHGNLRGIDLRDSNVVLDDFGIQANQRQGIRANKSNIRYNSSFQESEDSLTLTHQWTFSANGQHIELDDSTFLPTNGVSMDSNYGLLYMSHPHGVNNATIETYSNTIPSVKLTNGSKAEFVHALMQRSASFAHNTLPSYGSLISVDKGSTAVFRGSKTYATRLAGPESYTKQRFAAGVYANNNSNIEFTGPTVIAQFGVDVLADNNSTVSFNPPRDLQRGGCDASSFTLSDGANHTMVELHSTRACLVADNGSVINMEHLGDYQKQWEQSANGKAVLATGTDLDISGSLGIGIYVSAGSMQFYPNPNDAADYTGGFPFAPGVAVVKAAGNAFHSNSNPTTTPGAGDPDDSFADFTAGGNTYYSYLDVVNNVWEADSDGLNGVSGLTGGGMCVRAVHGSEVNVNNVHFPTGWANPSSTHYDSSSGSLCDRLFIWNIADNSKLFAAYTSVSANYPSDIGYFGPSSVWANSDATVAYAAPSSTPYTSSLSVLDYFGIGPTGTSTSGLILPTPSGGALLHPFGPGTSENQGPFRIYLSPNPVVNHMSNEKGTQFGLPNQLFSQGYQYSGTLYTSGTVSGLHGDVTKWNLPMHEVIRHDLRFPGKLQVGSEAVLSTNGFYYASEMLEDGQQTIFLEESAANTFANAKHLSVGKSGIPKKVYIYGPYKTAEGDSSTNANKNHGHGYKSSGQFDLSKEN